MLSCGLHWEPQSTILAFSVNDPLPDFPKFPRNGELGLGSRYGEEKTVILKVGNCTFRKDTLPDLQNFCRNGLIGLGTRYREKNRLMV